MRAGPTAALLAAASLSVAGCASVARAPPAMDASAKRFQPAPGTATIYVHRHEGYGPLFSLPVHLDGKYVGETTPRTFLWLPVYPGRHAVQTVAENTATVEIDAEAGRCYFVAQEFYPGMVQAASRMTLVPEAEGRARVTESAMVQPLLGAPPPPP